MRPGWNPVRRNRNVGTKAHGHGQDNRMEIPERAEDERLFFERLQRPVTLTRCVGEREFGLLWSRFRRATSTLAR